MDTPILSKTADVKEALTVVKVGGAVVEDAAQLSALLDRFAAIEGRKVLVHGGGRRATKIASALGIESRMVNGRRITDEEMLEVVTMVYGGLVNKNIVAQLQARGLNAIGLTGADLDVIRSHRRPPVTVDGTSVDFGFVGDVDHVSAARLQGLLCQDAIPVMAPLTHDGHGNMLNTNADTIASAAAQALASLYEVTLIYCFEKAGVLADPSDDSSVIRSITRDEFDRYVADGIIAGGMMPKIENAFNAINAGVTRVIITKATAIDGRHGTVVTLQ